MPNNADKSWWKKILENQKKEIDKITSEFETFFDENKNATVEELKTFVKSQTETVNSRKVQSDLAKRITALDKMKADNLTGDDLKEAITEVSVNFHDSLSILNATTEKGNRLLQSGFDKFKGVLQDSFGPVFELWDTGMSVFHGIKDSISGVFHFLQTIPVVFGTFFDGLFGNKTEEDQLDESKKQTGIFQSLLNYFERIEKRDLARPDADKDKGIFLQFLSAIVFTIGTALGTVLGSIVIQFDVFYKIFIKPMVWFTKKIKGLKFWDSIKTFFKRFTIFTKLFDRLSDFFNNTTKTFIRITKLDKMVKPIVDLTKKVGGWFGKVGNMFKGMLNVFKGTGAIAKTLGVIGNFLKPLISGLKFGMKVFGWPLTILLGVIDFFKAFSSTHGDTEDKIKAGLLGVVGGLIELPVKLLGWIADWMLGLFGVQIEGGAGQEIMDRIQNLTTELIDFVMHPFKSIQGWLQTAWNYFSQSEPGDPSIIDNIISMANNIWMEVQIFFGWITQPFTKLYNFLTTTESGEPSFIAESITMIKDFFSNIWGIIMDNTPFGRAINAISDFYTYLTTTDTGELNFTGELIDKMSNIPLIMKDWITSFIPSIDDIKGGLSSTWSGVKGFFGGETKVDDKEEINVPSLQSGGVVKKEGIVNVHPAEVIVPQNLSEKLAKTINYNPIDNINKGSNENYNQLQLDIRGLLIELKRMQDKQINNIAEKLKLLETPEDKTVNNRVLSTEPPDEIENLSLLVFNKSWGLG